MSTQYLCNYDTVVSLINSGGGGGGDTANWANYPATAGIDCNNWDINNCTSINLAGMDGGAITNIAYIQMAGSGTNINNLDLLLMSPGAQINANTGTLVNLAAPIHPGDAANKLYVDDWSDQKAVSTINCDGYGIINVAEPIVATDAATKNYVDTTHPSPTTWSMYPATATVDVNTFSIINVADPIAASDAATKNYVDLQFPTTWSAYDALEDVDLAGFNILNLSTPSAPTSAAQAGWVQSQVITTATTMYEGFTLLWAWPNPKTITIRNGFTFSGLGNIMTLGTNRADTFPLPFAIDLTNVTNYSIAIGVAMVNNNNICPCSTSLEDVNIPVTGSNTISYRTVYLGPSWTFAAPVSGWITATITYI